jgi:hypothetical protein
MANDHLSVKCLIRWLGNPSGNRPGEGAQKLREQKQGDVADTAGARNASADRKVPARLHPPAPEVAFGKPEIFDLVMHT